MGVLKQGILGGFSGKVANIIGTSWKGISVIKAMPLSVANPKTASQVAQRLLFKNCSLFGVILLAVIIKPLWDRFAIKMSGFNAFVKENIDLFTSVLPATPADLVISKGKMSPTTISEVVALNNSAGFSIAWVDDTGVGYKLATDIPYILGVNETTGAVVVSDGVTDVKDRADELIGAQFPVQLETGDVIRCYLAFKRSDGTIVSNTSYATVNVPA